jgi:Mg2+ and Co2+ transporter CorA
MRVAQVGPGRFAEMPSLQGELAADGFVWIACERQALEANHEDVQDLLQRWAGASLVWLHVSDLLNEQLPSTFEATPWYDLMVFRRLAAHAAAESERPSAQGSASLAQPRDRRAPALVMPGDLDTSPVGFALFDRVLLTVHPPQCSVMSHYLQRLEALAAAPDTRGGPRLPSSPAELMLRMVNHMVDGYLDLRRALTRQLGTLQQTLLDPKSRFTDWPVLLQARNALHLLEDTCEDQRSAVQEWMDSLIEWPTAPSPESQREHELLRLRTRDIIEHVDRVLSHVRRLEQSVETAVQMHFSALGHRTNDIMRTLTVLTAIFLPLNLITGFFGMNFDSLPWIHSSLGFWAAFALMVATGVGLVTFFRRKRYLG